MTFGATCSPSCAQFVKNTNAKRFEETHMRAVEAIIANHYVDDLLDCTDTIEETIELAMNVRQIHSEANFEIRNWRSNCPAVLEALGSLNTNSTNLNMNMNREDEIEKVLGMWWCYVDDEFTFSLKYNKGNENIMQGKCKPTKREMLRILMSLYYPLGLIAQFTSYLKVLLQDIWRLCIDWDTEINDACNEKWQEWLQVLPQVEKLRIPRCYVNVFDNWDNVNVQLHVFVDSSKECSSAVAYLRLVKNNTTICVLVGAKTRVAPLKLLSIPRLELTAALMGTRFSNTIIKSLTINLHSTMYWSDSKTVLSWIRSDTKKIKGQFVAFRISEIQESTYTSNWRYVPSKLNVADDATKWKKNLKIEANCRWYNGPEFLIRSEEQWPEDITLNHQTNEEMVIVCTLEASNSLVEFKRFSKYSRLLRAVAYVYKFCEIIKSQINKQPPVGPELLSEDLQQAEKFILKIAQAENYSYKIQYLKKEKSDTVPRFSSIYKLSPYLDEVGILRSKGRIDAAKCVEYEMKRPIILSPASCVTKLTVENYHQKYLHMHHETVINEIRKKFMIPACRRLLQNIRSKCPRCAYLNAKPHPPQMAPLPYARLAAYTHPFTYVGVDCLGPIEVSVKRRHEKRWVCLFTCLTTRGIHLEILHAMDTDSFILAFRNYMQRRGEPKEIYSDNGKNFVGAERILKETMNQINMKIVIEAFESTELKWNFNPPESPHMGGSWERLVKSVKTAFYATIPSRAPTDPLLYSYMLEVENIINSRPLTYLPLDSEEEEALTPNHFMRGTSGGGRPFGVFDDSVKLMKSNWRMSQLYAQRFWQRWVQEYLPELTRRCTWYEPAEPLKVGDLVLIVDPKFIRNCWQRGRIDSVKTGKDGQVKSAIVRTTTGTTLERPAVKLAKLNVIVDLVC